MHPLSNLMGWDTVGPRVAWTDVLAHAVGRDLASLQPLDVLAHAVGRDGRPPSPHPDLPTES